MCVVLTLLAVITVAPIWLCWWWMSRVASIRWTVTLIMVGLYAGATVVARFNRNSFLIFLLTVAVLVASVVTGRALEHRRLGSGSARRQVLPL